MLISTRQLARRGFSLIEILIVVVILGVCAAIVIPEFKQQQPTPLPKIESRLDYDKLTQEQQREYREINFGKEIARAAQDDLLFVVTDKIHRFKFKRFDIEGNMAVLEDCLGNEAKLPGSLFLRRSEYIREKYDRFMFELYQTGSRDYQRELEQFKAAGKKN